MCLSKIINSRRKMFYLYCPVCGKSLGKSEKGENELFCTKCKTTLRISLIPGLLAVKFDNKRLTSPEFDGDPDHDRRFRDRPAI